MSSFDRDFTGCHRACAKQGKHTRFFGECEFDIRPEPSVSVSKICQDSEGYKSISFDQYTLQELADLIEPALRQVNIKFGPNSLALIMRGDPVRPSGGEVAELARMAAYAILHRNETRTPEESDSAIHKEADEDRGEAARFHAAGDHQHCDQTCEVEMPSEALRNFILAKGYPGTGGALDELLRRASTTRRSTTETETKR